jgi:hypothetical protein
LLNFQSLRQLNAELDLIDLVWLMKQCVGSLIADDYDSAVDFFRVSNFNIAEELMPINSKTDQLSQK